MMEAVVCGILDVIFDGKELRWQENQLLYRDNPLGEDKYQPIAFDSKARLYLDEGKVVFEYLPISFGRCIYPPISSYQVYTQLHK